MLVKDQQVYYISHDYTIQNAIYKGEVYICPYISLYNLYRDDDNELNETNNFLINPDYVFETKKEAEEFLEQEDKTKS